MYRGGKSKNHGMSSWCLGRYNKLCVLAVESEGSIMRNHHVYGYYASLFVLMVTGGVKIWSNFVL
jgi:hypothetical protein